jgi:hypothetical protein
MLGGGRMFRRLEKYLLAATNVDVLAGLVLVVYELRQNRESINLDTQFAVSEQLATTHMALATDGELAELISAASAGETDTFSEGDHLRVRSWLRAMIEPRISYYWLRDSDFIDPKEWFGFMSFVEWAMARDYYRQLVVSGEVTTYTEQMLVEISVRCAT